jgi:thiol:disulfide interchange protein DsbC
MMSIRNPGAATRVAASIAASAVLLAAAGFVFAEAARPGAAPKSAASTGAGASAGSGAAQPATPAGGNASAASGGAQPAVPGAPTGAPVAAGPAQKTAPASPAPPEVAATIKKVLESRFKNSQVLDVQTTVLPNLYEVYVGDRVVYSTANGDYVLIGSLVDTRTRTDLSKVSMDRRNTIDFKSLPFDKAIKIVKGNGSRALAVFEDPDCPFCQRLETQLKSVTNVTEYVFLYPIDELHPQATTHSRAIWCAPDRAKAWTDWLLEKKAPPAATCKGDPISVLSKLGDSMHISGTPTMFTADGQRTDGAISAAEIEKLLASSSPAGSANAPAANR